MQIEYEKIKFMIIHLVMEIIIHGYPINVQYTNLYSQCSYSNCTCAIF